MCKTVIIPEVKTSNTVSHEKTVIRKCFIFNKQLPFTFTELPESETVCALYFEVCLAYYVVHLLLKFFTMSPTKFPVYYCSLSPL